CSTSTVRCNPAPAHRSAISIRSSSPWSALVTVSMVLIGMRASRALQSGSRTVLRPSVASVCAGAGRRSIVSETVAHAHDAAVLRVMADGETEIAAHGEHLLVL